MASAALAEFARMPTQRKVTVFVVIGVLAGLLYWRFVYRSLDDDLEVAQADHASKQQAVKKLEDDLPRYEELRNHMARLRELIEKNQTALPTAPELPAFFETLQHKVAESGVEIRKWNNRNEEPVESFIKVPVEIEIAGSFMQIKRFFASLVQGDIRPAGQASDDRASGDRDRRDREQGGRDRGVRERIVSIENLALSSPTVRNREIILTARFTAVTFRQEEKAAEKPAPGAPAARPLPPAPVSPPPPMPSAATPAGARARTDSAIDKGDQRNRNAAAPAEAPPAGSDRLKGGL